MYDNIPGNCKRPDSQEDFPYSHVYKNAFCVPAGLLKSDAGAIWASREGLAESGSNVQSPHNVVLSVYVNCPITPKKGGWDPR